MAVEVTLVWQLVEATASAYKAYKICHFVGLKKARAIVCVSTNKPGTAQFGATSKARKHSRKSFWKHLGKMFLKKVFVKKVA